MVMVLVQTPDTAMLKRYEEEKETTKFGAPTNPTAKLLSRVATEMTVFMVRMASLATAKPFLGKEERTS